MDDEGVDNIRAINIDLSEGNIHCAPKVAAQQLQTLEGSFSLV